MANNKLRIRKNSRGEWYPLTDLRERPSGEPIVFEWMRRRPMSIENLATSVALLAIGVILLLIVVVTLFAFGPLLGIGILLWTLGKRGR